MGNAAFSFRQLVRPCLMGIVNVTPDSFSDGGAFLGVEAAVRRVRELVEGEAGGRAGMVDLGAEATSFFRAGVVPVGADEQLARLLPVLDGLGKLVEKIVVSVDTRSSLVAREVLNRGVQVINDVSAGEHDPEMFKVVAETGAGIVLMHMNAFFPATAERDDPDIVATIREHLADRMKAARAAGIAAERIAIDPGVGFGKTMADNWRLALQAGEVRPQGFEGPVVLGVSRKRFLETAVPDDVEMPAAWESSVESLRKDAAHQRDAATAVVTALAAQRGVEIHRVHDVGLARRAILSVGVGGRGLSPGR